MQYRASTPGICPVRFAPAGAVRRVVCFVCFVCFVCLYVLPLYGTVLCLA